MRRNKYNARKTTVDGIVFASAKEARHYANLRILERAGKISALELQKPFVITVNGKCIATYKADFVYWECGNRVILDVKGFRTPVYRLKKRLVEALYNVVIEEA